MKPQKAKPRKRVAKEDSQDKIVIPEKVVPVTGLKVSVPSIELKTVSENMEKDAAAPVAAIKKESLPELKTEPTPTPDLSSEAAQVTAQPVISQAFEAAKEKAENENSVPANNEQIADNSVQPVPALIDKKTTQNPSVTQPSDNEMVFIPQTNVSAPLTMQSSTVSEVMSSTQQSAENVIQENNQPQLLVSAPSVNTKAGATEIEFAPGSEELTSDNQQKLDAIIASFENPTDNMIAINAYNYQASSWAVENGTYVRLKNVTLGYTFPQEILAKTKVISSARLYVTGADLWEFSKINDGWDPEASKNVSGTGRYPFVRTVTFGLNVAF